MKRGLVVGSLVALLGAMATVSTVPALASAHRSGTPIATRAGAARPAGTVNVSSLPRVIPGRGHGTVLPARSLPGRSAGGAAAGAPAPRTGGRTPTVTVGTKLSQPLASSDNPFQLTPPDVSLAVGGGKVVQMVNIVGRIWNGSTAGSVFDLRPFFLASGDSVSDPFVLFDAASGRFFAGIFDITKHGEQIAVSKTSDPAGSWVVYSVQYPGFPGGGCPDQAKGGVNSNVFALGFNEFSSCSIGGTFQGAAIEVFNKSQMVSGTTVNFAYTAPLTAYFSLVPAQAMTSSTTEFFAAVDFGSGTKVHQLTSTGVPPSTVTLTALADVTVSAYANPPQAKQPGTTTKLDSGDDRVQHVVWSSNTLALSATSRCTPLNDTKARACARVIAINTGTNTVSENTDISKKGHYYVYPALGITSASNIVATFGDSSGKVFPQLMATAGAIGGTFATPVVVQSGTKANTTTRYGDYFAVAIDPAATTNAWVAGEVGGPLSGSFAWNTAVAQILVT